jgi:hypothetical protein
VAGCPWKSLWPSQPSRFRSLIASKENAEVWSIARWGTATFSHPLEKAVEAMAQNCTRHIKKKSTYAYMHIHNMCIHIWYMQSCNIISIYIQTHTHILYIYIIFIHIVCMRLHLSHVCMFSPIGPSAWKTSPLKQWSSAPQWRAHGGGGAGENSLTCCWSTRCNCSNKQSLSTLKILKMLQILKCIFFLLLYYSCCHVLIEFMMFFLPPNNRLLMMSSGIWFPRRAPKRSRGPRRNWRKRIDQMVITQNVFIWYVTSFISIYIYTVYPTWSNIYI